MATDVVWFAPKSEVSCCDCGCCCSLTTDPSTVLWIRSVKRKYDEFESSVRFYIPGVDIVPVARVGIENECAMLRETVSSQQETIQGLCLELEEERDASSSAAEETMSMILRLQREKAEIQMESRQFKCFVEEKMSHDAQEVSMLEEVLYKREQTVQALTFEIQACKHRMMSFDLTEAEDEGLNGVFSRNPSFASDMAGAVKSPMFAYPPLRCHMHESQQLSEFEDDVFDVENYPLGETPRIHQFRNSGQRINQLEGTPHSDQTSTDFCSKPIIEKVIVGHSSRRRHSRSFSTDSSNSIVGFGRDIGPDNTTDSPRFGTSFKKLDCVAEELRKSDSSSDYDDDMSDRVYTINSAYPGAPYNNHADPSVAARLGDEYISTPKGSLTHADTGDPDVKKLYLRLQALESDRESMRQTIVSMQTDKAQLVLLREIAQQLCKDMTPAKRMPVQKPWVVGTVSFFTAVKCMMSLVSWRKKARESKYMFDLTPNNAGLLMLLDTGPRGNLWRCVTSTQLRK